MKFKQDTLEAIFGAKNARNVLLVKRIRKINNIMYIYWRRAWGFKMA